MATARAAGEDSASARPMPTAWEPWPGNRKAIFTARYQRRLAADRKKMEEPV